MDLDLLNQLQHLFRIGDENPITLRAIAPPTLGLRPVNEHFEARQFPVVLDRWAALLTRARALNDGGYNIYTCINPIRCDIANAAVRDSDIEARRLLLIDLDRVGKQTAPASEEEIARAHEVADQVETWFKALNVFPVRVMSGNGVHLYYPLPDWPNDQESSDLISETLKSLASKFDAPDIVVDRTVSNASRITKLPGTVARKGEETLERPYRKACFV